MTIVNTIKTKMGDSLLLTLIYTIGHFMIAVACVYFITGAPLELATIDAVTFDFVISGTSLIELLLASFFFQF